MKCSAIRVNGEWRDVFKNPKDAPEKKSKAGRLTLWKHRIGHSTGTEFITSKIDEPLTGYNEEVLQTVYKNGRLVREYTFDEVRKNSTRWL